MDKAEFIWLYEVQSSTEPRAMWQFRQATLTTVWERAAFAEGQEPSGAIFTPELRNVNCVPGVCTPPAYHSVIRFVKGWFASPALGWVARTRALSLRNCSCTLA